MIELFAAAEDDEDVVGGKDGFAGQTVYSGRRRDQ